MAVGETETLTVSYYPSDTTVSKNVIWSSSNTGVATVSDGKITARAEGTTIITANVLGKTSTCTLTVVSDTIYVTDITLNSSSVDVIVVDDNELNTMMSIVPDHVVVEEGDEIVIDDLPYEKYKYDFRWNSALSDDMSIVTSSIGNHAKVVEGNEYLVNSCYLKLTGNKVGSTKVTINYAWAGITIYSKEISVQVIPKIINATSIDLNKSDVYVNVDESELVEAIVYPTNATNKNVVWSSTNEDVATVIGGTVYGISPGTTWIKATSEDGKIMSQEIPVYVTQTATAFWFNVEEIKVPIGNSVNLVDYWSIDSENLEEIIQYTISNTEIAEVNENGIVNALKEGETVITASVGNGRLSDTCIITVTPDYGDILEEDIPADWNGVPSGIWIGNLPSTPYTGKEIELEARVYDGNKMLIEGQDYTLSYLDNINAGTATIIAKGKGNYDFEVESYFVIVGKNIEDAAFQFTELNYQYTGSAITPQMIVTYQGTELVINSDYIVEYIDNIEIGTATAIIKGIGEYYGILIAEYEIEPNIVKSIISIPSNISINVGEQYQIPIEITNANGENLAVIWSAENEDIVKIDSVTGVITGVSAGETMIIAECQSAYATCTVNVIDDDTDKQVVFISGITIQSKVYDGKPNAYIGNVVIKDSEGKAISDVSTSFSYAGTLANGSTYAETTEAPSQAGNYTLKFVVTDNDKYTGRSSYSFNIKQKGLTITAPSVSINVSEELPELSGLTCTVDGLLEADKLIIGPSLKYEAEDISTAEVGSCDIIPYGAYAGNNYNIVYINGILIILASDGNSPSGGEDNTPSYGDSYDDSPYEDADRTALTSVSGTIAKIKAKTYDGSPYEPMVKVTVLENNKKITLIEGIDYRVIYADNVNAGIGSVIVRGNGIYKGELTANFTINPKSIKKLKVVTGSMTVGDACELPIYVYDGTKLVAKGVDYTLSGTENLTAQASNSAKVTITGMGNYTGTTTTKVAVYDGDVSYIINPENVTLAHDKLAYTGKVIKSNEPTVKIGNRTLTKNKDYKVQYKNNKDAGTAFVIVKGKGIYKGTVAVPFKITPVIKSNFEIKTIAAKTYNGKLQRPSVTVKSGGKKLKKNKDYTVTYKNNLHAGTAVVIVTGKGNYTGQKEQLFTIKPQNISKVSVKGTKMTGLTITYSKHLLKDGTDYELSYGETNKNKIKVKITAKEDSDFIGSVTKSVKIGGF